MALFFNFITHGIISIGILALVYLIGYSVHKEPKIFEKVILIVSVMIGFLIYFGSKAIGISIPSMMMSAVTTTNPVSIGILAIILPSAAGVTVAWYCIHCLNKSSEIAFRIVILIGTFIVTLFGDVYFATYTVKSQGNVDITLLPNLTFTIGMGLYVILNYRHNK
jgi:hypothetical protein